VKAAAAARLTARQWPLAALLAVTLAAHAPALPFAAWPALLLAAASRALPPRRWSVALRLAAALGVYLAAASVWGWFAEDTLRLSLLAVLLLKWAEAGSAGEEGLVIAAALLATAIGSLNWGDGGALACVALALLAALFALNGAAAGEEIRQPARLAWLSLWRATRRILRHLTLALPLASALFVFFPRIPGPLWDIGLSFGLPLSVGIDQSPQGLGIAGTLTPGQSQGGAAMSGAIPVLVAEFRNWVPPTALLYWRGPVFYDFDGRDWKLNSDIGSSGRRFMSQGWRSARAFGRERLSRTAQEIRYAIRLSPHRATWLYALDLPSALPTEAFVGPDWQVVSHTPVDREMTYDLASWLEWEDRPEIAPDLRERALALPDGGNPRLRRLGAEWRSRAAEEGGERSRAEAVARAALIWLTEGVYTFRESFDAPQGADAFDAFWFDTRAGNAEFFAGAFVYLMRAAGVPARLVTGYRGGKLMALTDYVVVKRSHAHAWCEIWDEARGWRRIDPADIVVLQKRVETAPQARERAQTEESAPVPREEGKKNATARPPPSGDFAERAPGARILLKPSDDEISWLDAISAWIGRWIVRLDAERQLELLAGKGGGLAWVWLLSGAVCAAAAIAVLGMGFARWRDARRLPPAQRAWLRACAMLARRGLPRAATECPRQYARRVAEARPELAVGVRALGEAYGGWRYGRTPERWASEVARAARYLVNLIEAMPG
jgi:transglutaminase-like putative cysteine protease